MTNRDRSPKPCRVTLLILLPLMIACADKAPTAPAEGPSSLLGGLFGAPKLISCQTDVTESSTAVLDALGGTVSVAGSSIVIPAGGLLEPTRITLTVPASKYMEIEITANEQEHFDFLKPATVTIGYSRCSRSDISWKLLSAWEIDPETKALLQNMHGIDNKLTRTVTFVTGGLSGYAIAQ
jgi:hypothetical protein